jgi:hypothetical protein
MDGVSVFHEKKIAKFAYIWAKNVNIDFAWMCGKGENLLQFFDK